MSSNQSGNPAVTSSIKTLVSLIFSQIVIFKTILHISITPTCSLSHVYPNREFLTHHAASAVARHDRLEFLSDIVPQTQTYKAVKESKKARQANGIEVDLPAGQTTLDATGKGMIPMNGTNNSAATNGNGFVMDGPGDDRDDTLNDDDDSGSADPNTQLEMEIRGRQSFGSVKDIMETNGHANGNGHSHGGSGDVEMG